MPDNNQTPTKGYAAPLEGVVGREIASVLNLAFLAIGMGMLKGLGMQAAAKLGGPAAAASSLGGPAALKAPSVAAGALPTMASKFTSPRPPSNTLQ